MPDDKERVALELRRIREAVRERSFLEPRDASLPAPLPTRTPEKPAAEPEPKAESLPPRPDSGPVNDSWNLARAAPKGLLGGLLRRVVAAQTSFNSFQVQLDNTLLEYIDKRFDATHRHYDRVLEIHSRHLADVNERHLILQEELVAHVHDLVKRIDLVLAESEKGRLGLEFALRDLRNRLARLEERITQG